MPGAYLKAAFRGSTSVGLVVDGSINRGLSGRFNAGDRVLGRRRPIQGRAVHERPRRRTSFRSPADSTPQTAHRVEVFFRASDLTQKRWESPISHLLLGGNCTRRRRLAAGPPAASRKLRSPSAIRSPKGWGSTAFSRRGRSWSVNNARETWFPIVSAALDCEYGQLGSGGLGMTRQLNLPPLPEIWDHHDPATSRLTGGLLLPEPDYVFCSLGTNDFEKNITADYTGWLAAVRRACPNARVFCVVPAAGRAQAGN